MSSTGGYRDGVALWAAMTSSARETAKATRADLGDHFRFVIADYAATVGGRAQQHVDGYRLRVDAYCGAIKKLTFAVDLVTGSLMTAAPEIDTPVPVLEVRTQDVDDDALIVAIRAEWTHRSLPGEPAFAPPMSWDRLYPPIARAVRACDGVATFAAATELVSAFLGPALQRSAAGQRWVAADGSWQARTL